MNFTRKITFPLLLLLVLLSSISKSDDDPGYNLDLEDLLSLQVETATNSLQSLKHAPGTMVVVTAADIRSRGYTNLYEVLSDIPGFDVSQLNAAYYSVSYQRGLRSLGPNRTLFMINGLVSTLLWDAGTSISRQYPLNHIKRIEVLFGPASAVYGPNSISGIINVITKDSALLNSGETRADVEIEAGSYNTEAVALSLHGRNEWLRFNIGLRWFQSDEPNYSDRLGYLSNDWYGSQDVWGPILDFEINGRSLGAYYDPSLNEGVFADFNIGNLTFLVQDWRTEEGYGPFYAADRAQNNVPWIKESSLYAFKYRKTLSNRIEMETEWGERDNFFGGDWIEAVPDWNAGMSQYSFISYTTWKTVSSSQLFKHNIKFTIDDSSFFQTGMNYERKRLTKSYDIPGYWLGAFSSSLDPSTPGPYGLGAGIFNSQDSEYIRPPQPASTMPSDNLINTTDKGIFFLYDKSLDDWRYHLGIRFDDNSIYGGSVNPRLAVMHDANEQLTFKLVYGEAFHEPPALELYGGWNGRFANPDLQPEKLRSLEFITLYGIEDFNSQLSIYTQTMTDVIEFNGDQSSDLDVIGLEWRNHFLFNDLFADGWNVKAYLHYNYTDSRWNFSDGRTVVDDESAGSIARNKYYLGANTNLTENLTLDLRGRYVSHRPFSQSNALRGTQEVDAYFVMDMTLSWTFDNFSLTTKVLNALDETYDAPDSGCGCAGIYPGNNERSSGFTNPLVPQPERSIWFIFASSY